MLPLVLPPTVLGFYLLVGLLAAVGVRRVPQGASSASRSSSPFAGILVASLIVNLPFAVQPIQRAFEAIPPNVREAAFVSGLSPWRDHARSRAAARLARHRLGHRACHRPHAGRVRRHPHDRRQHPGRDARAVDRHLRQRAGLPHRRGGVMSAALLAFSLSPSRSCTCWRARESRSP